MVPPINSQMMGQNITQLMSGSSQAPQVSASEMESQFKTMLTDAIGETNNYAHQAEANIFEALQGGDITQAEVFTSMKKADLALKTMVQFRNKFLQMYKEMQEIRF